MPLSRARKVAGVCLAMKPVGKPDAGNLHVRFDERGGETERCRMAQATAPLLDSTQKIETDPERPSHIVTEMGVGYRLREPDQ